MTTIGYFPGYIFLDRFLCLNLMWMRKQRPYRHVMTLWIIYYLGHPFLGIPNQAKDQGGGSNVTRRSHKLCEQAYIKGIS